jgi:hypothetical protein
MGVVSVRQNLSSLFMVMAGQPAQAAPNPAEIPQEIPAPEILQVNPSSEVPPYNPLSRYGTTAMSSAAGIMGICDQY